MNENMSDEISKKLKLEFTELILKFYNNYMKKYIDIPKETYRANDVLSAIKNRNFDYSKLTIVKNGLKQFEEEPIILS